MSRTAEDQALIDGLNADVERLSAQITDLQASTAQQATERRTADLAALFSALGRDVPTGDAARPYLDMSDAGSAVFASDLRAAHQSTRKADAALFGSQGIQRAQGQGSAPEGAAALLAAVKNLSAKPATV